MPPVVVAVGAAVASTVAAAKITAAVGATTLFAKTAIAVGTSLVIGAVARSIAPKPAVPNFGDTSAVRNVSVMIREPAESRRIVYGRARVSGPIVFLETTNSNRDLHIVVAIAGHEVNKFDEVYFEDKLVRSNLPSRTEVDASTTTNPNYAPVTKLTAHLGSPTQAADSNLVSRTSWTSAHRLRNVAYIYSRLRFDEDVFANGIPNISAVIEGRKVFDPRTNQTTFSDNAALCIRDYLTDSTYGLGATADEIDDASFTTAANICDEPVSVLGGGTEKRYTINGSIDSANTPRQILESMLTACGGTLYWSDGKWRLKAGAFITPTVSIGDDDLAGPITLQSKTSAQEQFNAVKGLFLSEANNWQPTDYPEQLSSVFQNEDGGERKYADFPLVYTTSPSAAQRIARQFLRREREQVQIQVLCKLSAFQFEVGDVIKFNNERFGFVDKPFEVVSWVFSPIESAEGPSLAVAMTLKETSPQAYAWDSAVDEKVFRFNNTTLPSAFDVTPPGIFISDELQVFNEEAITVLLVDITSSNPFTNRFEVQARKFGDVEWINLGQASGNRFELVSVEDDALYEVRARAINTLGVKSVFAKRDHQVVGKTAPPSNVQRFTGNVVGGSLVLTWDPVPDLDLSHYKVRYSSLVENAEYQNSVVLQPRIPRPGTSAIVPARPGTYFIKAVDKLGLVSEVPAINIVRTNIPGVEQLNVVADLEEHPDFSGVKQGVVLTTEGTLVLDSDMLFDDKPGLFDDALGLFDGGGGQLASSGIYFFANNFDLGEVFTSRVTAELELSYLDYVNTFDSAPGLFDAREGLFDGDPNALEDINVEFQVRTTNQDPANNEWTDWQPFVVGDYTARAFEFRVILSTIDPAATPSISKLSVEIDMPDRVLADDNILSGAAPKNVTFEPGFRIVPAIGVAVSDLQTGDFYEITNKTPNGFTIVFKNAAGTPVSRRFDWIAKGFGRVEA